MDMCECTRSVGIRNIASNLYAPVDFLIKEIINTPEFVVELKTLKTAVLSEL